MKFRIVKILAGLLIISSCEKPTKGNPNIDMYILCSLKDHVEILTGVSDSLRSISIVDTILELRRNKAFQLINEIENTIILKAGGYLETYPNGHFEYLKNPTFLDSYLVISSTYSNIQFKETINLVNEPFRKAGYKYVRDLIDADDDPIMRKHPDWDNLEYKYVFDVFKGNTLTNSLQFFETLKLQILTYEIRYYTDRLNTPFPNPQITNL